MPERVKTPDEMIVSSGRDAGDGDFWLTMGSQTVRNSEITIEAGCDYGSSKCVAVIRIDSLRLDSVKNQEIHLTYAEVKWVRKQLKRAMKGWEAKQ